MEKECVRLRIVSRWRGLVVAACQCIGGGARIGKVDWSDIVIVCVADRRLNELGRLMEGYVICYTRLKEGRMRGRGQ